MMDSNSIKMIKARIRERAMADKVLLENLRSEVRTLRTEVKQIIPRSSTAVSLVAADGGNNQVEFDPYLFQLVRVVDSYGKELLVDVVSPSTDTGELTAKHLGPDGTPHSALGIMMKDLGAGSLWDLSPMIPKPGKQDPNPAWVQAYRDLAEWGALYQLLQQPFSTDTLIVRDGLLRSTIFYGELFLLLRQRIEEAIERIYRQTHRRVYLAGVAKRSKVLSRYRLAFTLEHILTQDYPCYVEVPHALEASAYHWPEYEIGEPERMSYFALGRMFMVKFGSRQAVPIWPVDVFLPQLHYAPQILGHLLNDAQDGFPIPFYPRSLQKAHEEAAMVGFDLHLMEDSIVEAIRASLEHDERDAVDRARMNEDVSRWRYS